MQYAEIRTKIRHSILALEKNLTQAEIGHLVSEHADVNFSAKDVNLLKYTQNNRWKGNSKQEKLLSFHKSITHLERIQNDNRTYTTSTESTIEQTIIGGLQAEFQAYQAIPTTENAFQNLARYFCKDGGAFLKIRQTIQRLTARKWIINNQYNPSMHELISIDEMEIVKNKAFLKTKEHWYLKWFDTRINDYAYLYYVTNIQQYTLIQESGTWKIKSNIYISDNRKSPPPILNTEMVEVAKNRVDLNNKIKSAINGGNTFGAIELLGKYGEANKEETMIKHNHLMSSKFNEITRLRNIDILTIEEYLEKRNNINEALYSFINELE